MPPVVDCLLRFLDSTSVRSLSLVSRACFWATTYDCSKRFIINLNGEAEVLRSYRTATMTKKKNLNFVPCSTRQLTFMQIRRAYHPKNLKRLKNLNHLIFEQCLPHANATYNGINKLAISIHNGHYNAKATEGSMFTASFNGLSACHLEMCCRTDIECFNSDALASFFSNHPTLQEIYISNFSIEKSVVQALVDHCPMLANLSIRTRTLEESAFECLNKLPHLAALKLQDATSPDALFNLNLRNLIAFKYKRDSKMACGRRTVGDWIMSLPILPKMRKFDIFDYFNSDFFPVMSLATKMPNLEHIKLRYYQKAGCELDFATFAHLKSLVMRINTYDILNIEAPKLETIKMSFIDDPIAKHIVKYFPKLQHVEQTHYRRHSDNNIIEILMELPEWRFMQFIGSFQSPVNYLYTWCKKNGYIVRLDTASRTGIYHYTLQCKCIEVNCIRYLLLKK